MTNKILCILYTHYRTHFRWKMIKIFDLEYEREQCTTWAETRESQPHGKKMYLWCFILSAFLSAPHFSLSIVDICFFYALEKHDIFRRIQMAARKKKQTVELCLSASSIYHMRDFNVSILTLFSLKQHAKETYRKWKALLMQQYRANCTEQKANKIQLKS